MPIAVFIEQTLFAAVLYMQTPSGITAPLFSKRLGGQLFWALLTGPFFLMFYEVFHSRIEKWTADRKAERNGF